MTLTNIERTDQVGGRYSFAMPAAGCDRAQIVTMLYRLLGE